MMRTLAGIAFDLVALWTLGTVLGILACIGALALGIGQRILNLFRG